MEEIVAIGERIMRELEIINDNNETRLIKILDSEIETRKIIKEEAEGIRSTIGNNQRRVMIEFHQTNQLIMRRNKTPMQTNKKVKEMNQ
jgi:hypothetical protein